MNSVRLSHFLRLVAFLGFAGSFLPNGAAAPEHGFVSLQPAQTWEEALVSGNGNYGALVYGRPLDETIVLNHGHLYMPLNRPLPPPETASHLLEIRHMLADQQYQRAADFVVQLSHQEGYGGKRWTDPFIPACDLRIEMSSNGPVQGYSRSTDFSTGGLSVNWKDEGGAFERRLFVSRADDVIVLSIRSEKSGAVNCNLRLATHPPTGNGGWSEEQMFRNGIAEIVPTVEPGWLLYRARFSRSWPGSLQGYEAVSRVVARGGTASVNGDRLSVRGADELLVLTRIALLEDFTRSQVPAVKVGLTRFKPDFAALLARQAEAHGRIFNRMRLDLGGGPDRQLPSEMLISRSGRGKLSPALLEREFDAGRYNILCSSGQVFPNLQGIWSGTYGPPWSGDFTLNGNVECALSADLPANMSECLLPFFDFLEAHLGDFRTNASRLYGCRGIYVPSRASTHGLNNHFDGTWPMTFWTAGAAWAAQFYYDYFLYTGDERFLRQRALPFMKQAALFYEDFLISGPDGRYLFSPSYSPENNPGNSASQAAINATMDISAVRELLHHCITASTRLHAEPQEVKRWQAMLARMPDYETNDEGGVKEWTTPLLADNDAHRHCSHLYALYDGLPAEIAANPPLRRAFEIALERRLDVRRAEFSGTSKSGLLPGEMAFGIVFEGFCAASLHNPHDCGEVMDWLARHYWRPNFVTTHNPGSIFNADLSGGFQALLIRMLVDSEPGRIDLLPAWPDDWPDGKIEGVACRCQIEISELAWSESKISATIKSQISQTVEVGTRGHFKTFRLPRNREMTIEIPRPEKSNR